MLRLLCLSLAGHPQNCLAPERIRVNVTPLDMNVNDLVFLPATEIARRIREKHISALEVVDSFFQQIERHNAQVNAIVTLDNDCAREWARVADRAMAYGEIWGPLHGVPITVKDALATAGLRTTSSFKPLAGYIPTQNATAVARLRAAGAIIFGKTNFPQVTNITMGC